MIPTETAATSEPRETRALNPTRLERCANPTKFLLGFSVAGFGIGAVLCFLLPVFYSLEPLFVRCYSFGTSVQEARPQTPYQQPAKEKSSSPLTPAAIPANRPGERVGVGHCLDKGLNRLFVAPHSRR
jgi:hypothetical protein